MNMGPTNGDRADWARDALETFANATRMDLAVESDDAIADLMHLAAASGFDAENLHGRALRNFEHERAFPDE